MSTNFRSNAITKMLDKIFDDKCLYAKSGSVQRGPGIICGFYILLIITGLIYNLVTTQEYLTKYGLSVDPPNKDILRGQDETIIDKLL